MLTLLLLLPETQACGGFFCNNTQPVLQAAERILFRVDAVGDVTTFPHQSRGSRCGS